jgi:hypothetical protein
VRVDLTTARAAWLSRSFFPAAPPGWDMAPAIAALRRRLTEWAAASPQALAEPRNALALMARRMAPSAQPMR